MSVTGRARSWTRKGLKVQRRVALAQMMFWPTVLGAAGLLGAGVLLARRRDAAPDQAANPAAVVG